MNITTASALIQSHADAGLISRDTAIAAQRAIRGSYYGNRMSGDDRRRMLANRFGVTPDALDNLQAGRSVIAGLGLAA